MKNIFLIILSFITFASCKKDVKSISTESNTTEAIDNITLIKGEFIFYTDAAVLQTKKEIYGVVIDEKMHELEKMVKKYKTEDTDMVPVEVKGKIIPKKQGTEGWDFNVVIKEIVNVYQPDINKNDIIKVGDNK